MKLWISYWQKWHRITIRGFVDAASNSYNHSHTWKESFEILKHQWLSLLVVQYPIFGADRVSKIGYFAWSLIVVSYRNNMMWIIKGPTNAARRSYHYSYIYEEGYEIVKHQWVSLIVSLYPVSSTDKVPEIWNISWNFGLVIGKNDTELP